jgi:hypothetical protein
MGSGKIILLTHPYDQGDILKDYIDWHLDLGADFVIAQDFGSQDGSREILDDFARMGVLQWFVIPDKRLTEYSPAPALVRMAIEQHRAEWIIMSDVDEFLCAQGGGLRCMLERARLDNITAITGRCFNMTGAPLEPGQRATAQLTLRIDRPVAASPEQQRSGDLPVPYIFIEHHPKTITWAPAFVKYRPGTHGVNIAWGEKAEFPELHFLHYLMRGFDRFETKVRNAAAYLANNQHLPEWWGWHWRRWIRLNEAGQLRDEYDRQFVTPQRAAELIQTGTCAIDETISSWSRRRG